MNNRGMALFFTLLVILVLVILLNAFFTKTITENNLVKRYVNSVRAFWMAEAGLASVKNNLAVGSNNGVIGNYSYQTNTTLRTTINSRDYYDIISSGVVGLAGGGNITRTLTAVVRRGATDASKFQYGITAANSLCFGGASCNKDPNDFLIPNGANGCEGHPCWNENDTTINFRDLFSYEQSEVSSIATHYTEIDFPGDVNGVTWVDVTSGGTLMVTGDLTGSGILIIDGNVHFGGDYQYHGIVYVLGTLVARGTFDSFGSVVVSSTSDIDNSINGNPTFHYDHNEIEAALNLLANHFVEFVSWSDTR